MRKTKYRAVPTRVDGIRFASKKEAKRYGELKLLERAGVIGNLELQPRFVLLEKQPGQRAITYVGDFIYDENGKIIVEDTKGFSTQVFKMKAKMFRAKYPNIELRIVK